MKVFRRIPLSLRKARAKGFQFAPLWMIFDIKVYLRRNSRLVIGGHVVNSSGHEVYASTMKSVSARILMKIAAANNLDVITGDICNSYLNTNTQENIYTDAGTDYELVGVIVEENFLKVIKALYGLPTSGNIWHAHLSHNLKEMGFKPTRFDPDVWIRGREVGYNYTGTHTNDVLVVAVNTTSIFEKLNETYTIKAFVPPKVHLGCDYAQVNKGATTRWVMGISTYITECLRKVCTLLKVTTLQKDKLICSPGDHPKLHSSTLLWEEQHCFYQQLVGMAEFYVQVGRFEICYTLTSLNCLSAAAREGHLSWLVKIFGYLQSVTGRRKSIVSGKGDKTK